MKSSELDSLCAWAVVNLGMSWTDARHLTLAEFSLCVREWREREQRQVDNVRAALKLQLESEHIHTANLLYILATGFKIKDANGEPLPHDYFLSKKLRRKAKREKPQDLLAQFMRATRGHKHTHGGN